MDVQLQHAATPPIFCIDEVCRNICNFVAQSDGPRKRSCRALLKTCKSVYTPALDAMWYESINFAGLINYFPEGTIRNGAESADDNDSPWTAFYSILRHIHVLHVDLEADPRILRLLDASVYPAGRPLMPNLKIFTWDETYNPGILLQKAMRGRIFELMAPHLPTIREAAFLHRTGDLDLWQTFACALPDTKWQTLTRLVTDFSMTTATLQSLGDSASLVDLRCTTSSEQLRQLSVGQGPTFTRLQVLYMEIRGTQDPWNWVAICEFIKSRVAHSSDLRKVYIGLHEYPSPTHVDLQEIVDALSRIGHRCDFTLQTPHGRMEISRIRTSVYSTFAAPSESTAQLTHLTTSSERLPTRTPSPLPSPENARMAAHSWPRFVELISRVISRH